MSAWYSLRMKSSLINLYKNISILSSQKIRAVPQERNERSACSFSNCFWFLPLQSKVKLDHCVFYLIYHLKLRNWEKCFTYLKPKMGIIRGVDWLTVVLMLLVANVAVRVGTCKSVTTVESYMNPRRTAWSSGLSSGLGVRSCWVLILLHGKFIVSLTPFPHLLLSQVCTV